MVETQVSSLPVPKWIVHRWLRGLGLSTHWIPMHYPHNLKKLTIWQVQLVRTGLKTVQEPQRHILQLHIFYEKISFQLK